MNMESTNSKVLSEINKICDAIEKLEDLDVIRSRKWVPDYGEWLVKQIYNAKLATSKTQSGWDLIINGKKVQVKNSFVPDKGSRYTEYNKKHHFDELIIIGFSKNLKIVEMYRISFTNLIPISKKQNSKLRVNWSDLASYEVNLSAMQSINKLAGFFA